MVWLLIYDREGNAGTLETESDVSASWSSLPLEEILEETGVAGVANIGTAVTVLLLDVLRAAGLGVLSSLELE